MGTLTKNNPFSKRAKLVKNTINMDLIIKAAKDAVSGEFTLKLNKRMENKFVKTSFFASSEGWLSPTVEGYNRCLHNKPFENFLKVSPGQAGRMFYVIYKGGEIITTLDAGYKTVVYYKEVEERIATAPQVHIVEPVQQPVEDVEVNKSQQPDWRDLEIDPIYNKKFFIEFDYFYRKSCSNYRSVVNHGPNN